MHMCFVHMALHLKHLLQTAFLHNRHPCSIAPWRFSLSSRSFLPLLHFLAVDRGWRAVLSGELLQAFRGQEERQQPHPLQVRKGTCVWRKPDKRNRLWANFDVIIWCCSQQSQSSQEMQNISSTTRHSAQASRLRVETLLPFVMGHTLQARLLSGSFALLLGTGFTLLRIILAAVGFCQDFSICTYGVQRDSSALAILSHRCIAGLKMSHCTP